jgi:hypothetical protein
MIVTPQQRAKLDEGKMRVALGDADTSGFVLLTIVLHTFGDDVFGNAEEGIEPMDPAEMWAGLNFRFGTWVTEEGENKLNAIITGLQDGMFWQDLNTFMAVSTALFDGDLGDLINVGFEDLSATEIMWAILEMQLAWDSDETPEYSRDVQEYVDQVLLQEQEDQTDNATEIEKAYVAMLDQLVDMGIPTSMIRALDEEYAVVMENLADGQLD